jgi:hypothetical protein
MLNLTAMFEQAVGTSLCLAAAHSTSASKFSSSSSSSSSTWQQNLAPPTMVLCYGSGDGSEIDLSRIQQAVSQPSVERLVFRRVHFHSQTLASTIRLTIDCGSSSSFEVVQGKSPDWLRQCLNSIST